MDGEVEVVVVVQWCPSDPSVEIRLWLSGARDWMKAASPDTKLQGEAKPSGDDAAQWGEVVKNL